LLLARSLRCINVPALKADYKSK